MRVLGNVLWFLIAGLVLAVSWFLSGLLFCITVIGIPLGLQCFKFARLALFPFGKEIVFGGPSVCGFLANVLWLLVFGWSLALLAAALGLLLCVTVVGIPFGLQCFKFSKLALMPFGASRALILVCIYPNIKNAAPFSGRHFLFGRLTDFAFSYYMNESFQRMRV